MGQVSYPIANANPGCEALERTSQQCKLDLHHCYAVFPSARFEAVVQGAVFSHLERQLIVQISARTT